MSDENPRREQQILDVKSLFFLGCWGIQDKLLENKFQAYYRDCMIARIESYTPYFIALIIFQSCMACVLRYMQSDGFTTSDKFLLFRLVRGFLWIAFLKMKKPAMWNYWAPRFLPWTMTILYLVHIVENVSSREWESIQFLCVCNVLISPMIFHSFLHPFFFHSAMMFSR
ncbi:hypothetical protein GUITHDRAFT_122416 [Guillardia theta CCMP2712]|uniref:Uncharacterized protein n=1 Tax=Guillardia theta (strain CCMP2712) TaxID=905079 RepID=L1I5N2_GUITC|nr:hypothetical protein GUITHDRAFT_122416 [Guillardia theta CCMP2712]EKX31382.1 hypothetical protein GUITHDRAFT_122416 [Guillardia theta CCMP2712]|eukprot:XP_005818362.1 hypothetical protein GUITHDRAFT_122416 [Guillardia theta CCMP2712]